MDNDTYDDRHSRQQKFNKNIVKRLEEIEDFAQTAAVEANARFDIGIENRTKAFKQIEDLEELYVKSILRIEDLEDLVAELKFDIETKLERIENILVVHRNQDRTQKKNYKALRDVWDKTVLNIIEKGEHEKRE